jgi:hypothetical protein
MPEVRREQVQERQELLQRLRAACGHGEAQGVLYAMESLFDWLVQANNNNDENCRAVDLFVCVEIPDTAKAALPEAVQALLADAGGCLHDTHTAPETARNFMSTPDELLFRTRQLMGKPTH